MSEPESSGTNQKDGENSTYQKAAKYWESVEPTISGMLGGINVGFLGK